MKLPPYVAPILYFKGLKIISRIFALWPLDNSTRKLFVYYHHFVWWFATANYILLLLPTLIAVYKTRHNISEFAVSWMETTVLLEGLVSFIVCGFQQKPLKHLLNSIEEFIDTYVNIEEYKFVTNNLMNAVYSLGIMAFFYVVIILSYLYNMYVSSKVLLTSAWYPFPITYQPLYIIILLHQLFVLFNSTSILIIDAICFTIMNCIIAKIDTLKDKYKKAQNFKQLANCVYNHQKLIWFVTKFNTALRHILLKTTLSYVGYFLAGGFTLLNSNVSTLVFQQFIGIMVTSVIRLFTYADTANKISETNSEINSIIYDNSWYWQSRSMIKGLVIVMQRCQKPITISYSVFMPSLDRHFFSHYVYINFSYFLTLSAIQRKLNVHETA